MRYLERDRPLDIESKSFIRRESSQKAHLDTFKARSPRGVVSSLGRARVRVSLARLSQQIFLAAVGCPWPTVVWSVPPIGECPSVFRWRGDCVA